jgi:hypothetical protein
MVASFRGSTGIIGPRQFGKERLMAAIILLDLTLTGVLLLLLVGYVGFQVSYHRRLKVHGTDVGALITEVKRDNIAHQTCMLTASWTDPRTGRRWTLRGFHLDLGYQPGQLIGICLDPRHPSHYLMEG